MDELKASVFRCFDRGRICVFPTEIQARFWLQQYALSGEKGTVFASRALAWDRFCEMFAPAHEGLEAADSMVRRVFAELFCASDAVGHLRRLGGVSAGNLASAVAGMLPTLNLVQPETQGDLGHDLELILSSYRSFLDARGLYEPLYDVPVIPDGFDTGSYIICFESAIDAFPLFDRQTGEVFEKLQVEPDQSSVLERFPNALTETRVQLRRIRELLRAGVNAEDIVITDLSLKDSQPYLEREARRLGVPISAVVSRNLSMYGAGNFFSDILTVISEDFSLSSVRGLVLGPGYPFRNPEPLRAMVTAGIQEMIVSGAGQWRARLNRRDDNAKSDNDKPLSPRARDTFDEFEKLCRGLGEARTVEELRRAYNALQDRLLVPGGFSASDGVSRDVYSYCVAQMEKIEKTMLKCNVGRMENLFSFFVKTLETTSYVPQNDTRGIRVYRYPQSAGLCPKHHFVIGLSQSAALRRIGPARFLSDADAVSGPLKPVDLTDEVLGLYTVSGEQVRLSTADEGFASPQLPPPMFLPEGRNIRYRRPAGETYTDEFEAELDFWGGDADVPFTPTEVQVGGYDAYRRCFKDSPAATPTEPPAGESPLSATAIDLFNKCPFSWKCKYVLKAESGIYTVSSVDHFSLGSLLHEVLEDFFKNAGVIHNSDSQRYQNELQEKFESHFESFRKKSPMSPTTLAYEGRQLRKSLSKNVDFRLLEGFRFLNSEKTYGSGPFSGRVDLVLQNDAGDLAVIDFKKGSVAKGSMQPVDVFEKKAVLADPDGPGWEAAGSVQLLVYERIVSEGEGRPPVLGAYFSVSDGKFFTAWKDGNGTKEAEELLDSCRGRMQGMIDSGQFPSKDRCGDCDYFAVCRRRYDVR